LTSMRSLGRWRRQRGGFGGRARARSGGGGKSVCGGDAAGPVMKRGRSQCSFHGVSSRLVTEREYVVVMKRYFPLTSLVQYDTGLLCGKVFNAHGTLMKLH
jgi:hypothetical protein